MPKGCFSWSEMISHMKISVSIMADVGLMPAVENFHFKAFPDQFVGLVLY